jgi:hypothetical protein
MADEEILFMEREMITGKCFCGAIQYKIEADILKSGVCHCHACQHLTGGVAWPFIVIPQESLIVEGDTKEFVRMAASGKPAHISFCGTCGSTLFGRPEIWPHIRIVGASSLDDKSHFSPNMHVWTEDAPEWALFDPNTPKFTRGPI